jgi:hypothetical protein
LSGNVFIRGYWQSYKFIHHIRTKLQRELRYCGVLSNELSRLESRISLDENAIAIHVRRGMNVVNGWPILSNGYLERALTILKEKTQDTIQNLYVFSDDPAWCEKEMLPGRKKIVVSSVGTTPQEDLHLMSLCRHFVISPSTFSWWAAYLGQRNGVTIAPDGWFFKNVEGFRQEDIFPPEWVVLGN